jgi:hypothetical protein
MRFGLTILTASLALLLPTSTALASAPPGAGSAKAKACKGNTVPVTVGKKTTCKPLAKALPKPKKIDLRLAYLTQALKTDPAKLVGGKKGKRARTLQSGFGAAGRRAQKKLLKVLPKALAFIDRKGGKGKARSSRLPGGSALASSRCAPGPAGPTGSTGGATIGALGDNGGFIDAPAGGGLRVRVTFYSCGGVNNFNIPECPTANGSVDAKGSGEFRATIEIHDGDRLVSRNSSVFEEKAKTHGEVGPNAKLKFIDVEHTQEVFIVASGGIVIRGGVTRKVRINMPGGQYNPANASVRFFGDSIAGDSGASAFASTAQAALSRYQGAEPKWSTFKAPYCAEPVFTPASDTLKLKKGDKKQLGIYAKAKDGGRASEARWTLLSPQNADFSPTSSESPSPSISYSVTDAPPGGQVKVTVKFTSTAGVGEKTWTQPTEPDSISKLEGNFSGEISTPTGAGASVHSWSGGATLERTSPDVLGGPNGAYSLKAGSVTYHVSGIEGLISACHWSGSAFVNLPPGGGSGGAGVFGEPPEFLAPYTYSIQVNTPPPPASEIEFTRSDCPEGAEELNDTKEKMAFGVNFNTGSQISADGIHYAGSTEENQGGITHTETWVFEGKP